MVQSRKARNLGSLGRFPSTCDEATGLFTGMFTGLFTCPALPRTCNGDQDVMNMAFLVVRSTLKKIVVFTSHSGGHAVELGHIVRVDDVSTNPVNPMINEANSV
jgi:predicted sugar kinase